MKLKLTILFVFLAAAVVYLTFKKDVLSYQATGPAVSQAPLTKESLSQYFQTSPLVDYRDAQALIPAETLNDSDRVIVHLWASWCAPCVNEVPDLISFARQEKTKSSQRTTFIAVSLDENSEDLNKFLKSFPDFDTDTFIRLWDKTGALSKLVDADRLPMTVMIEKGKPELRVVRGVVDWKTITF